MKLFFQYIVKQYTLNKSASGILSYFMPDSFITRNPKLLYKMASRYVFGTYYILALKSPNTQSAAIKVHGDSYQQHLHHWNRLQNFIKSE